MTLYHLIDHREGHDLRHWFSERQAALDAARVASRSPWTHRADVHEVRLPKLTPFALARELNAAALGGGSAGKFELIASFTRGVEAREKSQKELAL
jgi:hypothetical protein